MESKIRAYSPEIEGLVLARTLTYDLAGIGGIQSTSPGVLPLPVAHSDF